MPSSSGTRSPSPSEAETDSDSASSAVSRSSARASSADTNTDELVTPMRKPVKVASPSTAAPSPNSRAVTPFVLPSSPGPSQPVSPDSERELRRVENNLLAVSRDSTPTPSQPRRPHNAQRPKWGERKSALSKEFVQDSDDEDVDSAHANSKAKKVVIAAPPEANDEDSDVELETAAMRDEEGSESDYEDARDEEEEEIPAYPPTDPVKAPPTSSMPLVSLSQVSDLPDIPGRSRGTRQRRWKDADYETFLRSELTTKADVDAFLASRWLTHEDIRRLEATGRKSLYVNGANPSHDHKAREVP